MESANLFSFGFFPLKGINLQHPHRRLFPYRVNRSLFEILIRQSDSLFYFSGRDSVPHNTKENPLLEEGYFLYHLADIYFLAGSEPKENVHLQTMQFNLNTSSHFLRLCLRNYFHVH